MQHVFSTIETSLEDLLSLGIVTHSASTELRSPSHSLRLEITASYGQLLPEAIALTDAFGYSDWELDRFDLLRLHVFWHDTQHHYQRPRYLRWKCLRRALEARPD